MNIARIDSGIFYAGAVFLSLMTFVTIVACNQDVEAQKARSAVLAKDRIVTVSPREGVECYYMEGVGSSAGRVMSCVVLPPAEECM